MPWPFSLNSLGQPTPFYGSAIDKAFMKARRLVPLIGSVLALIAMVAWIGEIDLGLNESLQTPTKEQQ